MRWFVDIEVRITIDLEYFRFEKLFKYKKENPIILMGFSSYW
jgi:hypothetical protein